MNRMSMSMSRQRGTARPWRRRLGAGLAALWWAGTVLAADGAATSLPLQPAVDQAETWLRQNRLEPAIERLETLLTQRRATRDGTATDTDTAVHLGRAWGLLADAYGRRGQFALEHRARVHAVAQWRSAFGPTHATVLDARTHLALSLRHLQQPREAEADLRAVLATRMDQLPAGVDAAARDHLTLATLFLVPQHRLAEAEDAVSSGLRLLRQSPGVQEARLTPYRLELAAIQTAQGRPADAESVLRRILAFLDSQGAAARPEERIRALRTLGEALLRQGRYAAAEQALREAVQAALPHPGVRDVDLNLARTRLSELLLFQERPAEAEPLLRAVLDSQRRGVRGEFHPDLFSTWSRLGRVLVQLDRGREAVDLLTRLADETRTVRGARHPDTVHALATLAWAQQDSGHTAQAERTLRSALDIADRAEAGALAEASTDMRNQLGTLLLHEGRFAEAASAFRTALQGTQALHGATHPEVATVQANLAQALQRQGRLADAAAVLRQALAVQEASLGPAHHRLVDTLDALGSLYSELEDLPRAEASLARAITMHRQLVPVPDPKDTRLARLQGTLAGVWVQGNRLSEAEAALRVSIQTLEAADPDDAALPHQLVSLGGVHRRRGEFAQAQSLMERAVRLRRARWGPDARPTAITEVALARVLDAAGRPDAAEPLLLHALHVLDQGPTRGTPYVAQAHQRLAEVYRHTERPGLARTAAQAALTIYERTYGPQHADTVACRQSLETMTAAR